MALDNIVSNVTGKIKDGVSGAVSATGFVDAHKQKMKPLIAEKAKMYEFIGMEVFDMYVAGEMNLEKIEPFCQKIETLNIEIRKLESEITPKACECGEKLKKGSKFCSSCGKSIVVEKICECGEKFKEGLKFCTSCGKKVVVNLIPQAQIATVECVCGAELESGTLMCMECGRRVAAL